MNLLPLHGLVTWHIGYLENIGSLNYIDLPNIDTFHYKKITFVDVATRLITKVFRYWKHPNSQWEIQVSPNCNFYLETCISSLTTMHHWFPLKWQVNLFLRKCLTNTQTWITTKKKNSKFSSQLRHLTSTFPQDSCHPLHPAECFHIPPILSHRTLERVRIQEYW